MTDMENRACGKAAGVALEWMTSFPTSLAVDSLDLWVATEVAPGTGVEGEAKTWFTPSSMSSSFSLFCIHTVTLNPFHHTNKTLKRSVKCQAKFLPSIFYHFIPDQIKGG